MATIEECRTALKEFADNIAANQDSVKKKLNFERRLACEITDIPTAFHGRLSEGTLKDITDGDDSTAEIRLITSSDDLLALVDGTLDFGKAFASGRVKVKANLMDLLKLKGML